MAATTGYLNWDNLFQKTILFLDQNSIDDLTFDCAISTGKPPRTYDLGHQLHDLFTKSDDDIDRREAQTQTIDRLNGFGVTYEVLVENTQRFRNDGAIVNKPKHPIRILPRSVAQTGNDPSRGF